MKRVHIGDGVFASFDGFQVWLTTDVGGREHSIALEPAVVEALDVFVSDVRKGRVEPTQAPR